MGNAKLDQKKLIELLHVMVRIREFENEAIELAKQNLTRAAVHTYNGEEAIAAGVCAHLSNKDYITSTHRGHGHCVAKGADLKRMFAELMARESGYCKGKGGSMHIADLSTGMLGANGIVGGGIPLATGAALGIDLLEGDNIAVCFFGDGASNEGSFHESLNLASVWSLPVVFICENNKYGISTPVSQSTHVEHIADRAKGYGIKGITVNGNDVVEVYNTFAEVADYVRKGNGPVLMEMDTYRMSGHYYGDNENYRSKEEVLEWRKKDPILRLREVLKSEYGMTDEELDAIAKEERAKVIQASEDAKGEPEPSPDDLTGDMYDPVFEDIQWVAWQQSS